MPELVFKGKEYVYNHHLTVPYRPLIAHADKSVGPADLAGNLIIHGDNLHALKSLLPRYAGKVDLVFIDPPYNTGNENWSYNDNVNSPIMKEWLKSNPVNAEDMLRHDKWLCMMWPRLTLLRELMSERGSLWMTLDDNEVHRARAMLDEIFGAEFFVGNFVWQSKDTPGNNSIGVAETHNHVIAYRKSSLFTANLLERTEAQIANYSNPDGDPRGDWLAAPLTRAEFRERDYYPIRNKVGKDVLPPKGSSWRRPPTTMRWLQEDNRIWWGKSGDAEFPMEKKFLREAKAGVVNQTWWPYEFAGSTRNAGAELKEIFGGEKVYETPKPTLLIERILELASNDNSFVLDSFAGAGTTAHAVLRTNAKDGGSRQFILVECEDYADRISAERVRRVIGGYAFEGTRREELLRERLSWSRLQKPESMIAKVDAIRKREGFGDIPDLAAAPESQRRFDKLNVRVDDGALIVEGERRISERVEGLGGEFTFCTLGEPIDPEGILSGRTLPDFENLGAWLFYTATGGTLDKRKVKPKNWYLGEAQNRHLWLVYKPDLGFLKSAEAALTLSLAKKLRERFPNKGHLVFAPAKFLSNKQLLEHGVEYAPLPFALYREA
jgi:adenine-specific DNA-methyltransferase